MIRREDDHRVVQSARAFQIRQQAPDLVVALFDQPHVGWHDSVAHVVAAERLADATLHERAINRVRVGPFVFAAHHGFDVIEAVHVVIGRGHDVGPMRFDVADMGAPVACCLVHKFNRLRGQPRRFAVLFGDVCRLGGIGHEPTACHVITVRSGIGKIRPRVVATVTLGFKEFVIRASFAVIKSVRSLRPKPVIATPDIKPAFRLSRADNAVRRQPQPRHTCRVCVHVGLADQPAAHVNIAQVIAQSGFADAQGVAVPLRAVAADIAPCIGRHARGAAHGRLGVGIAEPYAHRRNTVDIRGLQRRVSGTAQIIEPQLIKHDIKDVHVANLRRQRPRSVG